MDQDRPQPEHQAGPQNPRGEFVVLLTSRQKMLHAYITTILGSAADAEDVLQTVNLKAWEKHAQFEIGTNFGAWVRTIAFHVIQDKWKRDRRARDLELRLRFANRVNEYFEHDDKGLEDKHAALAYCVSLLPDHHRKWLEQRYQNNRSIAEIAANKGCSIASVSQALYRIRQALRRCIGKRVAAEGGAP